MEKRNTIDYLIEEVGRFIDERQWSPYHSPKKSEHVHIHRGG